MNEPELKLDLRVKNGCVIDTSQGIDRIMDIGVKDGKMISIEGKAVIVDPAHDVDAEGCFVLPGLIDHHVHAFGKGSGLSIPHPDLLISAGVTAVVDAGTSGCATFENFFQTTILNSKVKVKCYLNAFTGGQLDDMFPEDFNPDNYNERWIRKIVETYPQYILGLKLRTSSFIVKDLGSRPLHEIKAMCRRFGNIPINVHITDPPFSMDELANALDEKDIFCHMYGYGKENILGADGKVRTSVRDARKRGVVFDAANGRNNFSFEVAVPAIADGFLPDIISTDVTGEKLFLPPHVKNLPSLMSKYRMLGMELHDVVRAVTETPARMMKMAGKIGTLAEGACGDITILKEIEKDSVYTDSRNVSMTGHKLFVTEMTVIDGVIMYTAGDFHV